MTFINYIYYNLYNSLFIPNQMDCTHISWFDAKTPTKTNKINFPQVKLEIEKQFIKFQSCKMINQLNNNYDSTVNVNNEKKIIK